MNYIDLGRDWLLAHLDGVRQALGLSVAETEFILALSAAIIAGAILARLTPGVRRRKRSVLTPRDVASLKTLRQMRMPHDQR
ncbi:hypothetical protein [Pontivivens ytuae]|uniref:Uncharacterized protein n=1 Tax=Pontivivens ytuae TaxID=2789856 RepID=A0A7S9LRL8_9RHOB|nr:hypothetical protein [Pontivivens ytuae]QPH53710.1 hypothetical protein I0K15_18320 [Pontivivens ytuae]